MTIIIVILTRFPTYKADNTVSVVLEVVDRYLDHVKNTI